MNPLYNKRKATKSHFYRAGNRSLCLFGPKSVIRMSTAWLVTRRWFDYVMIAIIVWSSLNLALDGPNLTECADIPTDAAGSCKRLADYLLISDFVVTSIFTLEAILKILARGLIFTPRAYVKSKWNLLDIFVVVISWVSLGATSNDTQLRGLRSLRALRAFRALRVISRFPGMRLVVNAVFAALPKVLEVSSLMFLFMFVLAVIGIQNFRGTSYFCNDPSISDLASCTGTWNTTQDWCGYQPTAALELACRSNPYGLPFPRVVGAMQPNFNNILSALLFQFELATGENWPGLMVMTVDGVAPGQDQVRDYNPAAAVYFIASQVVLVFFLLDLFASVVVDTYDVLRRKSQGAVLLTPAQQSWVENLRVLLKAKPRVLKRPPASRLACWTRVRRSFFALVTHPTFERVIMGCILANLAFMAMKHYGMNGTWAAVIETANYTFSGLFAAEAAAKVLGLGVRQYLRSHWSRFDFMLVLTSSATLAYNTGTVAMFLRVFRIARVFRLLRISRRFQRMLRTLVYALPSILNIGAVLGINYFVFAVYAINVLSGVRFPLGGELGPDANFESFPAAIITLFRCSTGENFNALMHNLMLQAPYCVPAGSGVTDATGRPLDNCGGTFWPPVFFILFYTITNFIMIKLFVAVVLDSFIATRDDDGSSGTFKLTDETVDHYREAWGRFAPAGQLYITLEDLRGLITTLRHPLGLANSPKVPPEVMGDPRRLRRCVDDFLGELSLVPNGEGQFQFHAVLQALAALANRGALGGDMGAVTLGGGDEGGDGFTLRDIRAAVRLQQAWRRAIARREMQRRTSDRRLLREASCRAGMAERSTRSLLLGGGAGSGGSWADRSPGAAARAAVAAAGGGVAGASSAEGGVELTGYRVPRRDTVRSIGRDAERDHDDAALAQLGLGSEAGSLSPGRGHGPPIMVTVLATPQGSTQQLQVGAELGSTAASALQVPSPAAASTGAFSRRVSSTGVASAAAAGSSPHSGTHSGSESARGSFVGSVREGSGGASSARNSWTGPPLPPRVSPAAAGGGRPRVPSLASIKVIVDGSAVSPGPVAGGAMHTHSGRVAQHGSGKSATVDACAGAAGGAGGEEGRYTGTATSTPSPAPLHAAPAGSLMAAAPPPQPALAPKRSLLHFAADGATAVSGSPAGAADATVTASDPGRAAFTVADHAVGSARGPRLSFTPAASRQGIASVQMASMPAMTVRAPAGARARLGGASTSQRSAGEEGVDSPR
jgi:hypothetical protein